MSAFEAAAKVVDSDRELVGFSGVGTWGLSTKELRPFGRGLCPAYLYLQAFNSALR